MAGQVEKRIPCEVYSRIVGYLRPVQNWNKGKREEFGDRKVYETPGMAELEGRRDGDSGRQSDG